MQKTKEELLIQGEALGASQVGMLQVEMFLRNNYLLRSVVAHWMQMDTIHGNECVPTLIGAQGCGKTTFFVRLLPPHLREYYLDHLNLSNKFDKEMALTNNLLVCLDELDAIRPSQHASLKQTLSKSKVNGRPIVPTVGKIKDHRSTLLIKIKKEVRDCDNWTFFPIFADKRGVVTRTTPAIASS